MDKRLELAHWITDLSNAGGEEHSLMRGLVERLQAEGPPLWRVTFALMTKHPEVLWRTVQWREGAAVTVRDQPHARLLDPFYTRSPVAVARAQRQTVRVRLEPGPLPFPICEDLRDEGGTDYLCLPLELTNGQTSFVSFASRAPGGFNHESLAMLDELRPFLARRLELESAYYATQALLDVYLGPNAGRRVMAGQFKRGGGELIDAAIWFSDMRDFTAHSDRSAPAEVITTLDAYFDAAASEISRCGGEVLKFIGDAVLAIFPVGSDARGACRRAAEAAQATLAALVTLNATRQHEPIQIGIALHRGEVMYGNIGARDRLDFTVISAAVNEASRLESLCKTLHTPLTLSEAFTRAASLEEAVDLGAHALRGVRSPLRVFTLPAYRPRRG